MKTKQVTYVYDMLDRRIAKDVDTDGNGTIDRGERYAYDGTDVALVYDRSDTLVDRLMYGPQTDQPLASEDASGDVLWFLADNQGIVRDVAQYNAGTDTTTVVNHLTYGSFGNITSQTNSTYEPRHTYTGREWDADSELFYYRARWYASHAGRFLSEDPLGFGGGDANLSLYVENGPVNFSDPTGWQKQPNQPTGEKVRDVDLDADKAILATYLKNNPNVFPNLTEGSYEVIGPASTTYNCHAHTMGLKTMWPPPGTRWPFVPLKLMDAKLKDRYKNRIELLDGLDTDHTSNGRKILLYGKMVNGVMAVQHSAIESISDAGKYESKLGSLPLILHGVEDLSGGAYGDVVAVYLLEDI